jgi:hypothetical protein
VYGFVGKIEESEKVLIFLLDCESVLCVFLGYFDWINFFMLIWLGVRILEVAGEVDLRFYGFWFEGKRV